MKRRKKKPTKGRIPFHQPWLQHDAEVIARWNANFPINTMVIYECGNKKQVRARTASLAYMNHPHSPVLIDLNCRKSVVLSRVKTIEKGTPQGHRFTAHA
jgi:hypothetical protein